MKQTCENCKWKGAPYSAAVCATYRNDDNLKDYWTPAKPWEKQWIVPDGCKILGEGDVSYTGLFEGDPVLWNKSDGHGFNSTGRLDFIDLIPKELPIEETEEFKEYSSWFHGISWEDHGNQKLSTFKALKKVFKMELK